MVGKTELDAVMAEGLERRNVPGVAVSIVEDGTLASTHVYGLASSTTAEPVRDGTVFEAASMGKPLTAWVTTQLVAYGLMDLDAPFDQVRGQPLRR